MDEPPAANLHAIQDNPVASHVMLREMKGELAALRHALSVEVARSDLLWDRAYRKHVVSDEDYALANDPEYWNRLPESR